LLALAGMTGVGFTSCDDDIKTDVAQIRPEGQQGTDPSADKNVIGAAPTITKVVDDQPNKTMTIEGTNLLSIIKITRTYVAETKTKDYNIGDTVVEDITETIDKEKSTNEALVLALADGTITAYYDPFDITKIIVDGGFNIPVPTIKSDGFTTDAENKTMTIEGTNLDQVQHVWVDERKTDLIEKAEITATKIVLPLWDGKIELNYDMNNENRIVALDGYKFPVPEIKSAKLSDDKTKLVVSGTNLSAIKTLEIAGEKVTLPEVDADGNLVIDILEGEMVATYDFNDGQKDIQYKGYKKATVKTVEVDLTKEEFYKWTATDGTGTSSEDLGSGVVCGYEIGKESTQGTAVYGLGSVNGFCYADLSDCQKMTVSTTGKGGARFLFNRVGAEGALLEINAAGDYCTVKEESDGSKTWVIDIAKIVAEKGYCHLNTIKVNSGDPTTFNSIKLDRIAPKEYKEGVEQNAAGVGSNGAVAYGTELNGSNKNDIDASKLVAGQKVTIYYTVTEGETGTLKACTIDNKDGFPDLALPSWGSDYKTLDNTKESVSFVLTSDDITNIAVFPYGKYISVKGTNVKVTKITVADEKPEELYEYVKSVDYTTASWDLFVMGYTPKTDAEKGLISQSAEWYQYFALNDIAVEKGKKYNVVFYAASAKEVPATCILRWSWNEDPITTTLKLGGAGESKYEYYEAEFTAPVGGSPVNVIMQYPSGNTEPLYIKTVGAVAQ